MYRSILRILCFLLYFCFCSFANETKDCASIETSEWTNNNIYVRISFDLPADVKLTYANGGFDVVWHNADVEKKKIDEASNKIYYKLKLQNNEKPVRYDMFYVLCGDTCEPNSKSGELIANGILTKKDIQNEFGEQIYELYMLILFAIIGGFLLNLMPCVFPIISIKLLSILKASEYKKSDVRIHTGNFVVGIFVVFMSLGFAIKILTNSISGIGWGFFMQSATFVYFLFLVFVACAIHFLGICNFSFHLNTQIHKNNQINNVVSALCSGALCALSAMSCAGPFSGVAIAGAILGTSCIDTFIILMSLCLGFTSPYLIFMVFPRILCYIPKPGKWTEIFQIIMGYLMLVSSVWVFSILLNQIGVGKSIFVLILTLIAICFVQIFNKVRDTKITKCIVACCSVSCVIFGYTKIVVESETQIKWIDFSNDELTAAKNSGKPIFLNFTAQWCMNCKYNERLFEDKEIIDLFNKNDVISIKCDWTSQNDDITKIMKSYDQVAVPLNIYICQGKSTILPTILTKDSLIKVIGGKNDK